MNVLESLFQMINKKTHGQRNGLHAKKVDNNTSKTAYIDQNEPMKHSNKINLKSTEFVGTFDSND